MRSSRASGAERIRARVLAWVGLGLVAAITMTITPALAQTPRSLVPTKPLDFRVSPERAARPAPLVPPEEATSTRPAAAIDSGSGKSGISVDALGALTGETVGILGANSGGFGTDMWSDTPREIIDSLMTLLPASPASRTISRIREQLLLTAAAVPSSSVPHAESLLLRRVRALFDSGDLASAAALLDVVPTTHREEALSKLSVDIALLGNELSRACETVAAWVDRSPDRYWQKALVFCEALNGAWERVDFGMRLLIELNEDDEAFFALMRAIGGETGAIDGIAAASLRPLDVAMARAARAGLPDPGNTAPPPWLLRAYIDDPGIAPASRFALAEAAESAALAEPGELTRIYEAMQVSPELLESAASVASADPGPTGRALLFRATRAQGSNFGKAQAIKQASAVAASRRLFEQMARLYTPMVRELDVTSQLGWFAADASLLFLAVGDFEAARPWLGIAEREAGFDPENAKAWLRTWPLTRLVAGDALAEWRADRLQAWWNSVRETDPENANLKAALLFGLLEALGDPVPGTVWRGLIGVTEPVAAKGAGMAVARALDDAIDAGRVGEAVSLLVIMLGTDPLETFSASVLIDAVEALYSLGLEGDARRLAFEVALASGL
jgi:hypothetical protein